MSRKTDEKTTIENKKTDESMNKQNRENYMLYNDRFGFKVKRLKQKKKEIQR